MRISARIDNRALRSLRALRAKVPAICAEATKLCLVELSNNVSFQIRPGNSLVPHSGGLSKSWTVRGGATSAVNPTGSGAVGYLASAHPGARIQEHGGDVTPVRAKYLAIPLDDAKTAAGVPRWKSPREVYGLSVIPLRGHLFLVRRTDAGTRIRGGRIRRTKAKIEWLWLLLKSVTVPASRYLSRAATMTEVYMPGIYAAVFQRHLSRLSSGGRRRRR